MKAPDAAPHTVESCPTIRLAHGDLATVDLCSCGMLRLHLGAITLRLTPEALSSVVETLGEALSTQSALRRQPRFVASSPATAAHVAKRSARGQT